MSTIIPDLLVGSVGFGPSFADKTISDLEAENSELIRRINRLTWVLERCIPADNNVANERLRVLGRGDEL